MLKRSKYCLKTLPHFSFGAYLTSSYSLNYPQHLENVILVDPWGMSERPKDLDRVIYIRGEVIYKYFEYKMYLVDISQ